LRVCGAPSFFAILSEAVMLNSHVSLGAGIAGALLLAVPVLHMLFGAGAPGGADSIVGLFGFALLVVSAAAGAGRG
jgi:hypothetical protein